MKIRDRAYVTVTNACLFVGVASAFGYDSIGRAAWVVAGSCAGVTAITMYIIRHWRMEHWTEGACARRSQASKQGRGGDGAGRHRRGRPRRRRKSASSAQATAAAITACREAPAKGSEPANSESVSRMPRA